MEPLTDENIQRLLSYHPADECLGECYTSRALLELQKYRATGLTPEEIALFVKCNAKHVSERELRLGTENDRLWEEIATLQSREQKQSDYWQRVVGELAGIMKTKDEEIATLKSLAQNGQSVIDTNKRLADELIRMKAERDTLARYINHLDIDEDVCKLHPECDEFNHADEDCIDCIINTLGRGLEDTTCG